MSDTQEKEESKIIKRDIKKLDIPPEFYSASRLLANIKKEYTEVHEKIKSLNAVKNQKDVKIRRRFDVIICTGSNIHDYRLCNKEVVCSNSAFFQKYFDAIHDAECGIESKENFNLSLPNPMKNDEFHEYIFQIPQKICQDLFTVMDWMHSNPESIQDVQSLLFKNNNEKRAKSLLLIALVLELPSVMHSTFKQNLANFGYNFYTEDADEKTLFLSDTEHENLTEFGGKAFQHEVEELKAGLGFFFTDGEVVAVQNLLQL